MNEHEWEEVKAGNFWQPVKEGESVEGTIISMDDEQFGLRVTIETKDKKQVVLPSHAVLQSRIKNCHVGDYIKVIFDKTELPKIKGHNPTNIYTLLKAKLK